jgi:hypothetical protein
MQVILEARFIDDLSERLPAAPVQRIAGALTMSIRPNQATRIGPNTAPMPALVRLCTTNSGISTASAIGTA